MTQEELLSKEIPDGFGRKCIDITAVNKFLESNVVIPKGSNRHPYADVLHEWIEGAEIQVKLDGNWSDYRCSRSYIDTFEYRIKPKEPVYEWQWAYQHKDMDFFKMVVHPKAYFTDEAEVRKHCNAEKVWKIEETKRECKQ